MKESKTMDGDALEEEVTLRGRILSYHAASGSRTHSLITNAFH